MQQHLPWLRDMTLKEPLPSWYCRLCRQPIDPQQLRLDPGAVLCWECKWRMEECTDGRR